MSHGARSQYNVFGLSSAFKTLTAAFVADAAQESGIIYFDGARELTLNLNFLSGSAIGEFCEIQIETSNDITSGLPTNWFVFSEDQTPDASPPTVAQVGPLPYKFPAVVSPAATTNFPISYSLKLQARWLRFKLKSTAGANFGSAWLQVWASEI